MLFDQFGLAQFGECHTRDPVRPARHHRAAQPIDDVQHGPHRPGQLAKPPGFAAQQNQHTQRAHLLTGTRERGVTDLGDDFFCEFERLGQPAGLARRGGPVDLQREQQFRYAQLPRQRGQLDQQRVARLLVGAQVKDLLQGHAVVQRLDDSACLPRRLVGTRVALLGAGEIAEVQRAAGQDVRHHPRLAVLAVLLRRGHRTDELRQDTPSASPSWTTTCSVGSREPDSSRGC